MSAKVSALTSACQPHTVPLHLRNHHLFNRLTRYIRQTPDRLRRPGDYLIHKQTATTTQYEYF